MTNDVNAGFDRLLSKLLDAELARRRSDDPKIGMSDVHEDVAKAAGISKRHLIRLKGQQQFPERTTLRNLAQVFPELGAYADLTTRTMANWSVVQAHQNALADGSTISILTGYRKPLLVMHREEGHENLAREMSRRIAENVLTKRIQYAFVFPAPDRPAETKEIERRTHLQVVQNVPLELPTNGVADLAQQIANSVRFFETDASFAWHEFPRYTVLYNAFSPDTKVWRPFGMLWERGTTGLLSPTSLPQGSVPLPVEGWTYLAESDLKALLVHLENAFSKKRTYPRPTSQDR